MFMKYMRLVAMFLILISFSSIAQAYIGPGAGITFIGALIGLVVAVFSAIGFIIFWPLRRAMKKRKSAESSAADADQEEVVESAANDAASATEKLDD